MFYKVAEHIFEVNACDEILSQMSNYAPFAVDSGAESSCKNSVFSLDVQNEVAPEYTEDIRQDEEGQVIICGRTSDGLPAFDFWLFGKPMGVLVCEKDFKHAVLLLGKEKIPAESSNFAVNNALMVLYALATAGFETALFHAAGIQYKGLGYLFLGKSGTGKSTHARLWLKYNEGSELFNDDNPVVRLFKTPDGKSFAKVYGSPWSGKTPCYKNVEMELGGFVLLSQAPFNKISPLRGVSAYAAIMPSISGMRWNKNLADGLHQTENGLASCVPVWFLECLPDEDAARLCCQTVVREIQ
ncbi:hypothetical protein [Fibrobacter sp. UWB7]|jgi:hypothetical protein|uniref:hypothetical protein n=1 Tax=Fibrobacter sp. UWB7 TaxID=1896206 RepID=UPI00091704E4|nr:hypothetical protein [Fibrobacter sp. UWB7]SHM03574.1 hypothetical protein SAMN05720467_0373 [Fibrobacter sp. UWB7]